MATSFFTPYRKGIFITALGVFFITPDSLFILLVDEPASHLMFWRNLFTMGLMLPPLLYFYLLPLARKLKKPNCLLFFNQQLWQQVKTDSFIILPAVCCYPLTGIFFVLGTQHNTVASNLIILSAAPVIAALLTALWLKKKVPLANWLAVAGVFIGIFLVMADAIQSARPLGALFSFLSALSFACYYIFMQDKTFSASHLMFMSATAAMLVTLPFVEFGTTLPKEYGIMLINSFFSAAIAFSLTNYASRFISAEETLLLFMLETLLGPIWVWWILHQEPSQQTLWGGLVVVSVIIIWSVYKITENRRLPKKLRYN